MLTMFVTIAMFINIKIIKNCIEEHDSIIFKRYCIYICIIYLFGMLTQYLFAVPAFFYVFNHTNSSNFIQRKKIYFYVLPKRF